MSTATVDERVVSMEFDNKQFEEGVKESLSTLEKLKLALKFDKGYTDALDGINKSVKNISFDGLNAGIEEVRNKFSAMEVIGVTALVNITNQAMRTGERLIKSLSLDQITKGFDKYAQKTSSVQTIVNATGKSMGEVSATLEKLNWFTDETSYNFLDMVNNIGKFTSNNIELERAETAMEGIATWAAVSGANANEASRAMYNISQAISTGAMKLMDWKSIENANMATTEFKRTAIETAAAIGTLKKSSDGVFTTLKGNEVTITNFNTTLADAWFTSEVLLESLNKYGGFAGKLYEASSELDVTATKMLSSIDQYKTGALDITALSEETEVSAERLTEIFEELSSDTYELGRKSFRAAQEAKTFTEAIDSVKDAVSTGWMNTFEIIFGDYNEAKQLWTGLANLMYDVFASSAEGRNQMLKDWKALGGRKYLLDAFANSLMAIYNTLKPIKEAWGSVFPEFTGKRLSDWTKVLADFTAGLSISSQTADDLRTIFTGVFTIFRTILTIFSKGLRIIPPVITGIRVLISLLVNLLATATDFEGRLLNLINPTKVFLVALEGIKISVVGVVAGLMLLITKIKQFTTWVRNIPGVSQVFDLAGESIAKLIVLLQKIPTIDFSKIPEQFVKMRDKFNQFATSVKNSKVVQTTLTYISAGFDNLQAKFIKFSQGAAIVATGFASVSKEFRNFFKTGDADTFISKILNKLTKLKDIVKNFFTKGGIFTSIFGDDGLSVQKLRDNMYEFVASLRAFAAEIGPAKFAAIAMSVAFIGLAGSLAKASNSFAGALDGLKGFFGTLSKSVKAVGAKSQWITNLGNAIGVLAASLALLALIPQDNLISAAKVFGIFLGSLALGITVFAGISAILKKKVGVDIGKTFEGLAVFMMSLASASIVLAAALKILDNVNTKGIYTKVFAIGIIMTELSAVTAVFGRVAPKFKMGAITILLVATSVINVVKALKLLDDLSIESVNKNMVTLLAIITSLGIFARGVGSIGITSAVGVLILLTTLDQIMPALEKLSNLLGSDSSSKIDGIKKNIEHILTALSELMSSMISAKIFMTKKGEELKNFIENNPLLVGLIGLNGLMITINASIAIAAASMRKIAISMIAMSGALYLATFTFEQFAKMNISDAAFNNAMIFMTGYTAMMTMFVALANMTSIAGKDHKIVGKASSLIIALGLVMAEMAGLMSIMGKLEPDKITLGISAIAGIIGALTLLLVATNRAKDVKIGTIAALMTGLAIIIGEMIAISIGFTWEDLGKAFVGMAIAVGGLSALLFALFKLSNQINPKKIMSFAGFVGIISLSFIPIAISFEKLAKYSWKQYIPAFIAMTGTFVILSAVMGLLSKFASDDWIKVLAYTGSIVVALGSLAGTLWISMQPFEKLANMNSEQIENGLLGILSILGSFTAVLTVLSIIGTLINAALGGVGGTALIAVIGLSLLSLGGTMALAAVGIDIGVRALENFVNFITNADLDMATAMQNIQNLTAAISEIGKNGVLLGVAGASMIALGAGFHVLAIGIDKIMNSITTDRRNRNPFMTIANGLIDLSKTGPYLAFGAIGFGLAAVSLLNLSVPIIAMSRINIPEIANGFKELAKASTSLGKGGLILLFGVNGLKKISSLMPKLSKNTDKLANSFAKLNAELTIFGNIIRPVIDVGTNFINGIVIGLLERSSAIYNVLTNIGIGMIKSICTVLGIHSPSRVGAWIAQMFGLGMTNQFESDADMIKVAAAKTFGEGTISGITGYFEEHPIGEVFKKFLGGDTLGGVSAIAEEFGYNFGGAADGVSDLVNEVKKAVGLEGGSDVFGNLADTMTGAISVFEKFDETVSISAKEMTENFASQLSAMLTWKEDLMNLLDRGISPELYTYLANMGQKEGWAYVEALKGATDSQIEYLNDLYASYSQGMPEQSAQEIQDAYKAYGYDAGEAFGDGTVDGIEASSEKASEAASEVGKDAKDGFVQGSNDGLEEAMKKVAESYADITEGALRLAFDSHSPSRLTYKIGMDVAAGLYEGIHGTEAIRGINTSSQKVAASMISAFGQNLQASKFKTIGMQVIAGFSSGIMSNTSNVLRNVTSFATSISNTMKRALKINSPSKVFEEIGKFTVEGFAEGLNKNASDIVQSTRLISNSAIDGMSNVIGRINNYISSDMDLDPVVRPRLDMSDLESRSNEIASIFNGGYSTNLALSTGRSFNAFEADKLNANVGAIKANNADVVTAIGELRSDITDLGDSMSHLQVVMNGDAVVGQIAPSMDQALGTRAIRNRREK